jgi:hypothetical protein
MTTTALQLSSVVTGEHHKSVLEDQKLQLTHCRVPFNRRLQMVWQEALTDKD